MSIKNFIAYYTLLLLVLCSWMDPINSPHIVLRLAYLVALVLPVYLSRPNLLPHILICFMGVSAYGFAASYMPADCFNYTYLLLVLTILPFKNKKNHIKIPAILISFVIYTMLIDLYTEESFSNTTYCTFTIILLMHFLPKDEKQNEYISYAFIIITLIISIFFFTVGDQFVVTMMGQDRVAWKDPNYLGCYTGIGIVCAYYLLVEKKNKNLSIATIVIGLIMLLLNGSRGAFIAVAVGIVSFTLFSKVSIKNKIIMTFSVVIGFLVLYYAGLFDLLIARMEYDEEGTGSGRTLLWARKINEFLKFSMLDNMIGIGQQRGFQLGTIGGYGFHNDYVAAFVCYGFIGFILFISMLIYPLIIVRKNKEQRGIVIALTMYLMVVCMTLEPMKSGLLPYYFFYMFIISKAKHNNEGA